MDATTNVGMTDEDWDRWDRWLRSSKAKRFKAEIERQIGDAIERGPFKVEGELLFINLKAANAIGITMPPSLLLRADKVIE